MILHSLTINNFKVLRGQHLYHFPAGVSVITGLNGSGKSTLLNALAYAFYGPQAIPGGKENVLTWGEEHGSVRVDFSFNGSEYSVTRSQKSNGTSNAAIQESLDGEWVQRAAGLDPTTRYVEQLLNIDRVGFLISVFSSQEELSGLSSLTPTARMNTVMRLRGLDKIHAGIDTLRADARALRKSIDLTKITNKSPSAIKEEIQQIDSTITSLTAEIEQHEHNLEAADQEVSRLSEEIENLTAHQTAYAANLAQREAIDRRRVAAEAGHRAAQDALGRHQPPAPGTEPMRPDLEALAGLQRELGHLDSEIKSIEDALDNSVCPFCNRPYENIDRATLEERLRNARDNMHSVFRDLREEQDCLAAHQGWERIREKWDEYQLTQVQARKMLHDTKRTLDQVDAEYQAIEPIDNRSIALEAARDARARAEAQGIVARGAVKALRDRLSDLTRRHEGLRMDLRLVEAAEAAMGVERRLLAATETAAHQMHEMKEELIGSIIPSLNDRASQLVSEMTDNRYTELILTPDYEIQYRNSLGQLKGFENLSGGEKDIFALALRLALADIQAENLGILVLDEVFESLDASRQEMTWAALQNLTRRYQQIILVTHVQEFRDRAPNAIIIR